MFIKNQLLLLLVFVLSVQLVYSQCIIPLPNYCKSMNGSLVIPDTITITSYKSTFDSLIPEFIDAAKKISVNVEAQKNNGIIQLKKNKKLLSIDQYCLTVTPKGIIIEAGNETGCFYGLQSALQLIHAKGNQNKINCMVIRDEPRYHWRGLMLDESRHFMGKKEVKRILDLMALHKLNKFHWHLTDSPGWRIEIKQYPRLTEIGSIGNESNPDAPAKYYSQDDIREIVEYAQKRFIEIIPEIDMPGHATSAVRAYPEFSGGGSTAYPNFTFNPGKKETYTFLTNILKEVASLFPSKYIHVGGDEVHFGNEKWNNLSEVKNLMKTHHLKTLKEVELYFITRMADSIESINKTFIGWDEIATANLPKENTVVMWWRQEKPDALEASLINGYQVVLCPRLPLYFDFIQYESHQHGRKWGEKIVPIESVYNFPTTDYTSGVPITNPLILGIQANVWTEQIHTTERMQFMTYPRFSALAEAAWTKENNKNFNDFTQRMPQMLNIYDKYGIIYFDYICPDNTPEIKGSK